MDVIARWDVRQWSTAALAAVVVTLAVGVPTAVIPNPVFGRPVDVTWWSYPVLMVTAVFGGLLAATYVRPTTASPPDVLDSPGRAGGFGGMLSFFAVGCPTCNKLVVLAVGSSGALDWFAPAQPALALISIALLGWALRRRLLRTDACAIAE